jgi:hypothetical protein
MLSVSLPWRSEFAGMQFSSHGVRPKVSDEERATPLDTPLITRQHVATALGKLIYRRRVRQQAMVLSEDICALASRLGSDQITPRQAPFPLSPQERHELVLDSLQHRRGCWTRLRPVPFPVLLVPVVTDATLHRIGFVLFDLHGNVILVAGRRATRNTNMAENELEAVEFSLEYIDRVNVGICLKIVIGIDASAARGAVRRIHSSNVNMRVMLRGLIRILQTNVVVPVHVETGDNCADCVGRRQAGVGAPADADGWRMLRPHELDVCRVRRSWAVIATETL